MDPFRSGNLYATALGAGQPLTLVMAESAAAAVWVDQKCELVLTVTGGGTACDSYEFEVQDSSDGVTFATVPIRYGFTSQGIRVQTDGIYRKVAAAAERWIVRCVPERIVRFRARRVGGAVDTTLLIVGTAREAIGAEGGFVPMSQITPFDAHDGGGQHLNIAAAAVTSAQLTVGARYHVKAEAPCYWVTGGAAVAATNADYYLFAGETIEIEIIDAAHSYISCIRQLTDAANGFHIVQATR